MSSFLELPSELIIDVFTYLDIADIFACVRTCRFLDELIGSSVLLRYLTQLSLAGMQDNPYCTLPVRDKLAALKERETAWQSFDYKFVTTVDVPYKSSGVYDVTPSTYFLGKSAPGQEFVTAGIQSVKLPSQFPDESDTVTVEWNDFDLGMNIIDFGTSVEEHDLLACVSSIPDKTDPNICHIIVVLVRYSTKKTYEDCENSIIPICEARTRQGIPNVSIEIVGENLALIVVFKNDLSTSSDYMYIYDWKTGRSKSDPLQIYNTGLTFLREDILVNPNIVRKSLDIYHIPPSSLLPSKTSAISVNLIHSLALPSLTRGQHITCISCRSDPNPTSNSAFPKYTRLSRPYANDPSNALVILTLEVRPFTREVSRNFIMIVHRKSLLDFVPSERDLRDAPSRPITPRGIRPPIESLCSVTPWADWGPDATRWFNADDFSTVFITTTCGQRCIQFTPAERNSDPPLEGPRCDTIHILDFNPWHVKVARHLSTAFNIGMYGLVGKILPPTTSKCSHGENDAEEPEENICRGYGAFQNDIVGRLPYLVRTSEEQWDYDAVLLDEERILGMREQSEPDTYKIENIDVMYFG